MQPDYLLLTFVVVVGALGAVLLLALVRLAVANRRAKQRLDDERDESALVTARPWGGRDSDS